MIYFQMSLHITAVRFAIILRALARTFVYIFPTAQPTQMKVNLEIIERPPHVLLTSLAAAAGNGTVTRGTHPDVAPTTSPWQAN